MNLEELNKSQREAVLCLDAPSLVIAGAGSGKTRVLTYKIAYLLEQGMKPWSILALTFTNKAAREMRERIGRLVGEELAAQLWMGTFHSVFSRILRREADLIGFTDRFTIYDAADAKNLVGDIIREMQLPDKQYKASACASRISNAKNALILPSQYYADSELRQRDQRDGIPAMGKIYERYFLRCRQSNAMDFDDLLLYTWKLFDEHPEVAERYQERFEYVLVDEYQDTNYAQHQIVWQLTSRRQRLSVVGDDAQSIYSFRGANIDNILEFQDRYTDARLFKLEQNYRSTQNIVGAANSLISHNQRQIRKDVFSQQDAGPQIGVYNVQSDIEESIIVQREVQRLMRTEHVSPSEIAILYRTNAQSRALEEALRKNNVPYRIYGGLSFYQRKEIKDAIAYFRLVVNPHDEIALLRVINYPARGIGNTTIGKLHNASMEHQLPMWEVLQQPELLDVNQGTRSKLNAFVQMISAFHERAELDDAYTLAMDIVLKTGLRAEVMRGRESEDITRQENLQELMDHLSAFVQDKQEEGEGMLLHHYLEDVSLLSDMDEAQDESEERVTLMTVHASKGLEFDAIFVVGLEEELFPSQMAMDSPRQIEEERRLFYVAMTRARRYLTLTSAKSRFRYGKVELTMPSRFLREIDTRYLSIKGGTTGSVATQRPSRFGESHVGGFRSAARPFTPPVQLRPQPQRPAGNFVRLTHTSPTPASAPPSAVDGLAVGQRVQHARFGEGVVQSLEGAGMDAKATILFNNGETRKLLLRFAQLTRL